MSDWYETDDDAMTDDDRAPTLTTGDMEHGDHVTLTFDAEPEMTETDTGDALRADCTFVESSHEFQTMNGDPFEPGMAVALVTWSSRLRRALIKAGQKASDGPHPELAGETVRIEKQNPNGDRYGATYDAVLGEPDDDGDDDGE